jgi:hypothetical protein
VADRGSKVERQRGASGNAASVIFLVIQTARG